MEQVRESKENGYLLSSRKIGSGAFSKVYLGYATQEKLRQNYKLAADLRSKRHSMVRTAGPGGTSLTQTPWLGKPKGKRQGTSGKRSAVTEGTTPPGALQDKAPLQSCSQPRGAASLGALILALLGTDPWDVTSPSGCAGESRVLDSKECCAPRGWAIGRGMQGASPWEAGAITCTPSRLGDGWHVSR